MFRHVFADQYRATDLVVDGKSKYQIVFTGEDGKSKPYDVYDFEGPGPTSLCNHSTAQPA
eukprot:2043976-Amphidinium_carterae.1